MSRIVIKYGGSNLRTPEGIKLLRQILSGYSRPVVVVSALHGVTDSLEEFLVQAPGENKEIFNFTRQLYSLHAGFVEALVESEKDREVINQKVLDRITELENLLLGIYYLGELQPHLHAYALSYGERLSALLISEVLNCAEALPEKLGLTTYGDPQNATIDLEASRISVQKGLSNSASNIVPGFYGLSKDGKVNLLGRGGTDYSAACIAHCLDSESLDVWKDAVGFRSCDPGYIPSASRLETLTYDEAAELAYFGAKILHPRTVEPLVDKKIPIRLFSTSKPSRQPLTIINGKREYRNGVVKSITHSDQYSVLKLSGAGVGMKPGVLGKIATALHDSDINISSVITSQIAINLIIRNRDASKARKLIRKLSIPVIKSIELLSNITLLALVGHGMVEQHGLAARAFSVLARNNINVHLSSMGASDVTTYLLISKTDKLRAVEEIHHEFFKNEQPEKLKRAG